MIHDLLIAVIGVVGLSLVWLVVQTWVRRQSPGQGEEDVLSCVLCDRLGFCFCGTRKRHRRDDGSDKLLTRDDRQSDQGEVNDQREAVETLSSDN